MKFRNWNERMTDTQVIGAHGLKRQEHVPVAGIRVEHQVDQY